MSEDVDRMGGDLLLDGTAFETKGTLRYVLRFWEG